MSEKRHATLDAKNTDTYQKRKKARDEREKQQRLEQQQRMWKKSASLESLHIQPRDGGELAEDEREALRTAYVTQHHTKGKTKIFNDQSVRDLIWKTMQYLLLLEKYQDCLLFR